MAEFLRPPSALVLTTPGINRDFATKRAYEAAGGRADIVHINQLLEREVLLDDYQIFSIPGGFSYGDHIQGGRVLALQLQQSVIADQIYSHLEKGRFIYGACNGFQAIVQSGLLPFGKINTLNQNAATLTYNKPMQFQSRWIYLKPQPSKCLFVEEGELVTFPVAHGEGRFLTIDESTAMRIQQNGQIVYQYCDALGDVTEKYPDNPNGSPLGIAGICDSSGQILGMMPHPEDFVDKYREPNWRRMDESVSVDGLKFFQNIVDAAKHL